MSSDDPWKNVVQRILREIAPQRLRAQIEQPANRVIEEFHYSSPPRPTHWDFINLTQDLSTQLHAHASRLGKTITPAEACSEACRWLDRCFPSSQAAGSDTALLEFLQDKEGTVSRITQAILSGFVDAERQKRIVGVWTRELGTDFTRRHRIATAFFELFSPDLPPEIASSGPDRFVDSIEALLLAHAKTQDGLRQLILGEPWHGR